MSSVEMTACFHVSNTAENQVPGPAAPSRPSEENGIQRFFRIPFARPADEYRDDAQKKHGMWYAHFDGQWIARQMEIYPDKAANIMVAGALPLSCLVENIY